MADRVKLKIYIVPKYIDLYGEFKTLISRNVSSLILKKKPL